MRSRASCSLARLNEIPRFWIAMQIVIVVCVLIAAVIAIVRLV
jgi:hypothetical protein